MVGIYKITNLINGKIYIGQSVNIEKRWKEHLRHWRLDKNSNKILYKAFNKYGIENFSFDILEECENERLDELEEKYIKNLNSQVGISGSWGYNVEKGGCGGGGNMIGETNNNSKMTENEVYNIREMYVNMITKKQAFESVKNKISICTFSDIWTGKTWKHIHYDVYTDENKNKQRKNFKRENHNRKVSDADVLNIRNLKNIGKTKSEVFSSYQRININTFNEIWYNKTFKEIQSDKEDVSVKNKRLYKRQDGEYNPVALFSKEDVLFIRGEKRKGKKLMEVYPSFSNKATYSCFYNLWNDKTYRQTGDK